VRKTAGRPPCGGVPPNLDRRKLDRVMLPPCPTSLRQRTTYSPRSDPASMSGSSGRPEAGAWSRASRANGRRSSMCTPPRSDRTACRGTLGCSSPIVSARSTGNGSTSGTTLPVAPSQTRSSRCCEGSRRRTSRRRVAGRQQSTPSINGLMCCGTCGRLDGSSSRCGRPRREISATCVGGTPRPRRAAQPQGERRSS
jgi:hypothetical protein